MVLELLKLTISANTPKVKGFNKIFIRYKYDTILEIIVRNYHLFDIWGNYRATNSRTI